MVARAPGPGSLEPPVKRWVTHVERVTLRYNNTQLEQPRPTVGDALTSAKCVELGNQGWELVQIFERRETHITTEKGRWNTYDVPFDVVFKRYTGDVLR